MKRKYLVTGVAGSGKSTVCRELERRGYESHGIEDIDGMFAMYRKDTKEPFRDYNNSDSDKIRNAEWICDVRKLKELLSQQKSNLAFYCGVASNIDDIVPLFDVVILLRAQSEELHRRLMSREGTEDMGNTEESRQVVLGWKDWWENEIEDGGATLVDANKTVDKVVDEIVAMVLS